MSKLKIEKYILIKYVDNKRRIYLNTEKIPIKSSIDIATNCSDNIEENCDHNINNKKYKYEYKNNFNNNFKKFKQSVPYWMEHPEVCKSKPCTKEELEEMENLLKEYS